MHASPDLVGTGLRPAQDNSAHIEGRALAALIIAGGLIGCSPILVRLSHVGPVATSFWRLLLALMPIAVVFAQNRGGGGEQTPVTPGQHLAAAIPGVFLASDLATWQISLHMTSVANATLLVNMAPIFVTLGGWLLFRQPVTRWFLAGLATSLLGVVVLRGGVTSLGGGNWRGDALALGASVFYAGYMLMLGRARERFSTSVVMLWSTVAAAVFTLPIALLHDDSFMPWTLAAWAVLVTLGWVTHAGGQGLVAFALAWLPTTFSSLTLLIQPVVAAILAWLLLSEPLTVFQITGGTIVILALSSRSEVKC